ncbi:MAG: thiolase family protein [Candidatus Omnitrophica bacterium]|nr:thiolase family protein [Candidatus Omnitrophota bacterium]
MDKYVIIEGVRTPQGILGGALKDFSSARLGELVVRGLLQKTKIDPKLIEGVIFGCVGQTSDAPNVARVIALKAGLPISLPGYTVQRNCASGMQSIVSACQHIAVGDADVQVAGGTESMSQAPYINRDLRFGKKLRDSALVDSLWEGLTDPICGQIMGRTAENLAEEFKIPRAEQDRYAIESHARAFRATREGKFKDEIVPVEIPKKMAGRVVPSEIFSEDEGPNVALTEQMLSQYPTIFKEEGTVTAGNACPISDGAACVLIMSAEKAKSLGLKPMASIRAWAFAALEPQRMGLGPAYATPLALKKAGLTLADIDLIEINEAFAVQVLACRNMLDFKLEKTNVQGGAIALGHPVGTSGTRLVITLMHEMKRRGAALGLATLCVGGGQGSAMILERK